MHQRGAFQTYLQPINTIQLSAVKGLACTYVCQAGVGKVHSLQACSIQHTTAPAQTADSQRKPTQQLLKATQRNQQQMRWKRANGIAKVLWLGVERSLAVALTDHIQGRKVLRKDLKSPQERGRGRKKEKKEVNRKDGLLHQHTHKSAPANSKSSQLTAPIFVLLSHL